VRESRGGGGWRTYEYWDNRLHRAVAQATANIVLLALLDSVNTIRRTVTWGRLRRFSALPDSSHHSFAEHERLVQAITERDPGAAAEAMRVHLRSVRDHLLMAADYATERRA
jgi:DNA-binding FadR family transcriptional regulator